MLLPNTENGQSRHTAYRHIGSITDMVEGEMGNPFPGSPPAGRSLAAEAIEPEDRSAPRPNLQRRRESEAIEPASQARRKIAQGQGAGGLSSGNSVP